MISRGRPHVGRKKWGVDTNFVKEKAVDSCCVSSLLKDYQKELWETYKQKSYTTLKKKDPLILVISRILYANLGEGSFKKRACLPRAPYGDVSLILSTHAIAKKTSNAFALISAI